MILWLTTQLHCRQTMLSEIHRRVWAANVNSTAQDQMERPISAPNQFDGAIQVQ